MVRTDRRRPYVLLLAAIALSACGKIPQSESRRGIESNSLTSASGTLAIFAGVPSGAGSIDGTGSAARFYYPSGVAVDGSGNVYVADMWNSTIRKVTPAGAVTTLAGSAGVSGSADGIGSASRFYYPSDVAVDGSGNVYVADSSNSTIRKVTPAGVVTTLAGSAGVSGSADGTGSAARFSYPESVAVDGSGNVYVADTESNTIRKVTPAGAVTTLAGSAGVSGSADGTGSAARFNYPEGVAVDGSGNVYVADTYNYTIRKVTPAGVVTTLAGSAGVSGSADGTGSAARFYYPRVGAVDGSGNVYVADGNNSTIRKVTPAGVVTTLAGSAGVWGSADGTGSAARFYDPQGVAVDRSGNVYVADSGNSTIRKVTPAGVVTTLAGSAGLSGRADGTGSAARFDWPSGVAVDGWGNVYVADSMNSAIRKITPAGEVTTLAGGRFGSVDGTGSAARFSYLDGVAVDGSGNVYVADSGNHTIRKVTTAGVVTTLAGSAGVWGSADGTGSAAQFSYTSDVAVDESGNVYVTDYNNHTIRKITPAGVVTTLAGTAGVSGSADGTGSAARFNDPTRVAVDSSNNIYVADRNNAIRKITPAGVVSTIIGGLPLGNFPGPLPASLIWPQGIAVNQATGSLFTTVDSAVLVASNSNALTISPSSVMVLTGDQHTFTASGGSGNYNWSVSTNNSGGSITLAGVYTAGSAGGVLDTVKVIDSDGESAAATVPVTAPVTISPTSATVAAGGHQTFIASGGSGSFTWSVPTNNSGGAVTSAGVYTAGSTAGVADTVKVSDSNGALATATVTVTAPVTISPTSATVAAGGQQTFTASGGSGSYTWAVSTNSSGGSITSAGVYTAGSTGGVTDIVKVTVSSGASATATITVTATSTGTSGTATSSGSKSGGGCGQGPAGLMSFLGLLLAGAVRRRR